MPVISKAQFAFIAGVNRKQMTVLCQSKKLTETVDHFLDTDSPKNKAYLKKHGVDMRKHGKEEPLAVQKIRQDMALKRAQTEKTDMQNELKRGDLVPRPLVAKWFAQLNAGLKPTFLEMPKRLLPELAALIREGKEVEARTRWEAETMDALARVLTSADDATREALKHAAE